MIVKAIQKINPNAIVNVIGSDIDTCTIEWLDGTAEISKEDIKSKMAELPTAEEEATEKANNKTSAQNKLKALGLTDAEIEAL
jgi:copper oxidase (laccase) domain-containing protein